LIESTADLTLSGLAVAGAFALSLRDLLQPLFPARVRSRGPREGEVDFVVVEDDAQDSVRATVHGRESHEVLLRFERPRSFGASCTCPLFRRTGACRHVWAVVREVDERGLLLGRSARECPSDPEYVALDPRRELWKARLDAVRTSMLAEAQDPWEGLVGARPRPGVELLYVIDLDDTQSGRGLVLRPFWREQQRNHRWSRRRPYDPELGESPPLEDPLDRRIFRGLRAARRSAWTSTAHLTSFGGSGAYWLDDAESELLLPLLCATHRAYLHHHGGDEAEPAVWDEGEPWRFGARIERDEGARRARLVGYLARGSERLALSEPHVCLRGFVFLDGRVARLDAGGAWPLFVALRGDGPLEGPLDDASTMADGLVDLPAHPELEGELLHLAPPAPPRPHLEVGPETAAGQRRCRLSFRYGALEVSASDPRGALRDPASGRVVRRDWAAEREARRAFLEAGGGPSSEPGQDGQVEEGVLEPLALALAERGWSATVDSRHVKSAGPFELFVRSGVDWFDLEGGLEFEGLRAELPELLAAIEAGRSSLRLSDGSLGLIPERAQREWSVLAGLAERREGGLRFRSSQGWLLDRLLKDVPGVDSDQAFARLTRELASFERLEPLPEPESFQGALRGYQRVGLAWFAFLRRTGLGGCLADDMGLGKTVQVLALLEERRAAGKGPALVVVPRSLLFHWREEAGRFAPALRVLDHTGPERDPARIAASDLVLTTYGTLRRDVLELRELPFDYVILDEAQAIKNARSHSAKAARLLTARHRLALSGTPVENHLGELWSLFDFLNPGMLGRARAFRALIGARGERALDAAGRARLAGALRPFLLRRTKEQVLPDLPPKVEQILWCELSEPQAAEYEGLRRHYRQALIAGGLRDGQRMEVLTALLRLRQAACHPGLIDETRADELSAKLEVLLPHLEELVESGHKALVFSQFTKHLAVVRKHVEGLGLEYAYLDGSTRDRESGVRRFREDAGCPLLLMSLKAGGLGLNLVEADYVFLLDPWWNPATETQAIDRAHRIGRQGAVVAYRLIARGTVEEKVLELQERKRELASLILASDEETIGRLTIEELEALFA